jgi:hypothetical protein
MANATWLSIAALALCLFSACGDPEIYRGEGSNSGNQDGGPVVPFDSGVPIFTGDGAIKPSCTPKTCADVGADCGDAIDGCDGILHCGACPSGQACSIQTPNKCTELSGLCQPAAKAEVCTSGKECGLEGDGCGGQYECGACKATESCGYDKPFECAAAPAPPDVNHCPGKIATCAVAAARCGIIGNGCGGSIDCDKELGACPAGTVCGAVKPYQCDKPSTSTPGCTPAASCAALGWACGTAVDSCGVAHDCAAEGRKCGALDACVGGITGPTKCQAPAGGACPLCAAVPNCTGKPQLTRVTGRVLTPGRTDGDTGNQVGVPNAFVYIVRSNDLAVLPAITTGIPATGTSCDRCDTQDLGPVLASATTTATGTFTLEGNIPVGQEFLLVVKVGKFRRATRQTLPAAAACTTTALPQTLPTDPTRLPRTMTDGLAVNIPHIAVTTGLIDAMECVFEKMGIAHGEFGDPGATGTAAPRIHLYRGGPNTGTPPGSGARIDNNTPHDSALYTQLPRMLSYDMVVADCEGTTWDSSFAERDASGANIRAFVNRGGRMFASHLSFSWLDGNGTLAYAAATAANTGLNAAGTWDPTLYTDTSGTGRIAFGRPRASPRLQNFADWAAREGVAAPPNYTFNITDPRSTNTGLGPSTEEFAYRTDGNGRSQQFSFNTPYGAPAAAACGRVAYSGFHVAATGGGTQPFANVIFPNHCTGSLTPQEKVLLFSLFDLGSCVGQPPGPPACTPVKCVAGTCGLQANGCGGTNNCGACPPTTTCKPTTCAAQGVECGKIGDSCGKVLNCGVCPGGQVCGGTEANKCTGFHCTPLTCEAAGAECGNVGDGCGALVDCGQCPAGQVCGLVTPFKCSPPECTPTTCLDVGAQCGLINDGCGTVIDCGSCNSGQVCGRTQTNKCSGIR